LKQPMTYVLVIHGMGVPRWNETVLSVVNRFADARYKRSWPPPNDILTLGTVCGQTGLNTTSSVSKDSRTKPRGRPWLEFAGIPADPRDDAVPFLGEETNSGANLRFVDVHWSDLLKQDYPFVGQDPELWANGLLGRLCRKETIARRTHQDGELPPQWAMQFLGVLRETILLFHRYASIKSKDIDELVFAKYLGDVQLYGEFSHIRGRAARRFHDLISMIETFHETAKFEPPEYVVLAHSLGTVMSLDALMYAHACPAIRAGRSFKSNLPFPGYLRPKERKVFQDILKAKKGARNSELPLSEFGGLPNTSWIRRVKSFVTLGAPIDKFLVLWWLNYRYLAEVPEKWMEKDLLAFRSSETTRIQHYNYCEEQDPVGHNLDIAASAAAFGAVFKTREDKVMTRYAIPGLAHTNYWKDRELFAHILHRAVDGLPPDPEITPPWFDQSIFWKILIITYLVIPAAVVAFDLITFGLVWKATGIYQALPACLTFFLSWLAGRYVTDLIVWWRKILRAKESIRPVEALGGAQSAQPEGKYDGLKKMIVRNVLNALSPGKIASLQEQSLAIPDRLHRLFHESLFQAFLIGLASISLACAGILIGAFLLNHQHMVDASRIFLLLVTMSVGILIWVWFFYTSYSAWSTGQDAEVEVPFEDAKEIKREPLSSAKVSVEMCGEITFSGKLEQGHIDQLLVFAKMQKKEILAAVERLITYSLERAEATAMVRVSVNPSDAAHLIEELPKLNHLQVRQFGRLSIQRGWKPSDVEALRAHVQGKSDRIKEAVERLFAPTSDRHGTLFRKAYGFSESQGLIGKTLSFLEPDVVVNAALAVSVLVGLGLAWLLKVNPSWMHWNSSFGALILSWIRVDKWLSAKQLLYFGCGSACVAGVVGYLLYRFFAIERLLSGDAGRALSFQEYARTSQVQ
jgi:hypothetical protein